jgi:hypothetical protein
VRKVVVLGYKKNPDGSDRRTKEGFLFLEELGEAVFHQFGIDHEEYDNGPGNFSVAIVEWPDGRVESVYVARIRFINPLK